MSKQRMAMDFIYSSRYAEFPDIIATIQLAMHFAKVDYRNVHEAMRFTARECLKRAQNDNLRGTLQQMAVSPDPTHEMTDLYICQMKMRDNLAHELKGQTINSRRLKQLRE